MELVEDEDTGAQAAQDLIELRGLGRRIARFGLHGAWKAVRMAS